MSTIADTQHGANVLEIFLGFLILNAIHPRQHRRHDEQESLWRRLRGEAEEDDEAAEAEESGDEPDGVSLTGQVGSIGEAASAEAGAEGGEFVVLL